MVSLDTYTAMMAARCEYQIRADWDFNPGLFSLAFASKVNLGQSMSIQRALRRGAQGPEADAEIGAATVRIYKLLWEGEYINAAGQRTIYLHSLPTTSKNTNLLLAHRPGRSSQRSNHVVYLLTHWQVTRS